MKLRAFCAILALLTSADAARAETPAIDWSNTAIQCTSPDTEKHAKDAIAPLIKMIYLPDPAASKLLDIVEVMYVKNQREVSRTPDKLVCSMEAVFNVFNDPYPFLLVFYNQDGHAIVQAKDAPKPQH
jgi:hypothetical protein